MSRLLPIVAVQAAPVAWDAEATWDKFESEVRELRTTFPNTRLFLHPELYLAALGPHFLLDTVRAEEERRNTGAMAARR